MIKNWDWNYTNKQTIFL